MTVLQNRDLAGTSRQGLNLRTALLLACTAAAAAAPAGWLIGCGAPPAPEMRIVEQAATALGGAERVRAVRMLTMEGGGDVFALGQNRTLDGPVVNWHVTNYRRAIDFEHGRWRDQWTQTAAFVTGWPDPTPVIAGYDADVAFDIQDGQASRQDPITARDRRAELYHHPIGFLRAALTAGARLERARTEGDDEALDLIIVNGERFTLYVDRNTHMPRRIVSKTHVAPLGDVRVSTAFGAFIDAATSASASPASGGSPASNASPASTATDSVRLKVPSRLTTRFDDTIVTDLTFTAVTVDPSAPKPGELEAPADARAAAASTPARVTVEEVAPGVWYLAGEGHHSVVAEFADHLTLIEAPVDDRRTLAVIQKARALRPAKPLTQVINTHHHFDHSGGLRAAIAEGLAVITHEANQQFCERIAARPATVAPDALASHPRPLAIETVSDTKVLSDGARRLEIYAMKDSPHCAAMLMVYFPKERLLVEADAYQPPPLSGVPPRMHPFAANLLENIRARGLQVDRMLPIHGRIVPFADLVAAARTSPPASTVIR
jgi:glyoxylase-like metal-dependent hydrolase (beta-lactamase superfamily II)